MVIEKAKAGCMGCAYENEPTCPADDGQLNFDFGPCVKDGEDIIYKEESK